MRTALAVIVTVFVLAAALACGGGGPSVASPTATAPPATATAAATPEPTVAATATSSAGGNVVDIVNQDPGGSGQYQFEPSELTFSLGDTVTFRVTAETEFHTFELEDLSISQEMEAGQTVEFTVTLDTAGTFGFYCIPHESLGMTGTITVN